MDTNDIILCIMVPVMIGVIGYFYQRDQRRADANAEKLEQISTDVTTLMAKQEGQLSFAKSLMDSQAEQVLIHKDISKIHERLDEFYDYIRKFVNKRIESHETEHHSEIS